MGTLERAGSDSGSFFVGRKEGTEMQLVKKPLTEIVPYEKNPRKNDDAVAYVMESIKQCTYVAPIIVDEDGVILAGHTRYKALKKLGYKEADVLIKEGLTEEQKRKYRLLDNKTNEFAEWDDALLAEELDGIDFDGFDFGFLPSDDEESEEENPYTAKINIPQYEITGDNPQLSELVSTKKSEELIAEIESADIPDDIKAFLKTAAQRHNVFNYRNIAEYYAHADEDVQRLMEKSALVIIDYDNAIANGYVQLTQSLAEIIEEEND